VQRSFIIGLLVAAAAGIAFVLYPGIPLGIPSEWKWHRHPLPESVVAAIAQYLPAFFGITVLGFVAIGGSNVIFRARLTCEGDKAQLRRGPELHITAALLAGLVFGSWVWLQTCQRCAPSPHRELKSLWVPYDKASSGYFFEAAFRMSSTTEFLADYEDRLSEGDVYHIGTHPPGLFLISRWTLQLCDNVAWLVSSSGRFRSRADVEVFRDLESSAGLERPLENFELTALHLLSEFATLAAALTVIPLYYMIRRSFHAVVAWRCASLWVTFPCLAIFLPKSDVAFTFTSMTAVALGVFTFAPRSDLRIRIPFAVAAGLTVWCGLLMSLAHLPVLFLLIILSLIRTLRCYGQSSSRTLPTGVILTELIVLATVLGTICLATLIFSVTFECNLISIWQRNLINHAAFYEQHTRTWWKWLLVNPVELALSVGLPVTLVMICGVGVLWQRLWNEADRRLGTLASDVSLAVLTTIGLLWFSGRTSGEAARLWCFLTPWLLVLVAQVIRIEVQVKSGKDGGTVWHVLLAAQMLTGAIVCGRVGGFSF